MVIVVIVLVLVVCAVLGRWIARQKGRSKREGTILGLLFGPFGCLVEGLLPTLNARTTGRRGRSGPKGYRTGPTEPGEMPEDWGEPKAEPDDGVDMGWLK